MITLSFIMLVFKGRVSHTMQGWCKKTKSQVSLGFTLFSTLIETYMYFGGQSFSHFVGILTGT